MNGKVVNPTDDVEMASDNEEASRQNLLGDERKAMKLPQIVIDNQDHLQPPAPNGRNNNGSRLTLTSRLSEYIQRSWQEADVDRLKSIGYALMSVVLQVMYSFLYKSIEAAVDAGIVQTIRGSIQMFLMAILVQTTMGLKKLVTPHKAKKPLGEEKKSSWIEKRIPWKVRVIAFLAFGAVLGGARLAFIFEALQSTTLGNVASIMQGSPLVVMVIGHFCLSDKFNWTRGIALFLLLGGIVLNALPDDLSTFDIASENIIGVAYAFIVMIMSGMGTAIMKPLSGIYDRAVISFWFGCAIYVVGLVKIFILDADIGQLEIYPTTKHWLTAIVVGLFGAMQQFFLISAISKGSAVQTAMIRSLTIAISYVLQTQGLNEEASQYSIAGAVLISTTAFLMIFEGKCQAFFKKCKSNTESNDETKE